MTAHGDNPAVHFIRDGRFICTADDTAACHNYPDCGCEAWSEELHGETPAEGHGNVPQSQCWIEPWMEASDLCDTYSPDGLVLDNSEFPDGPISIDWGDDYLTWAYADETDPSEVGA